MRMLLTATLPNATVNAAIRHGSFESTLKRILTDLKPEAAYFITSQSGERCALVVLDMKESSELPRIAEPWFLAFNASISVQPAMNAEDLATAGPVFEHVVKEFASY